MLDKLAEKAFAMERVSHATAILEQDFPEALADIESVLLDITIPIEEIIGSGGGETKCTQRMRHSFSSAGWKKTNFEIKKIVNGVEKESITHEIDHVKEFESGVIALEIEWNNKDPFFDRDLENFKRLHAEGAISLGVTITRSAELQESMKQNVLRFAREHALNSLADLERHSIKTTERQRNDILARVERQNNPVEFAEAWADKFVSDKYGEATTHWRKLEDRVKRGVGNPCPLLLVGLPASIVQFPAITEANAAQAIADAVRTAEETA